MLPRCFPDASPSPRCFPDASPPQMPPTDASQMPPRCSPEAPRMLPTCFPASQMPPRCLPDAPQIFPICFPDPRCLPNAPHEIQILPRWVLSLKRLPTRIPRRLKKPLPDDSSALGYPKWLPDSSSASEAPWLPGVQDAWSSNFEHFLALCAKVG